MPYHTNFTPLLSAEQAEFIKDLRVNQDYSWRAVARDFVAQYPEFSSKHGVIASNQLDGADLCWGAMSILNEEIEQGWN